MDSPLFILIYLNLINVIIPGFGTWMSTEKLRSRFLNVDENIAVDEYFEKIMKIIETCENYLN